MNTTIRIAPVRKSIVVKAPRARAFEVFTAGIDRWWPREKTIASGLARTQVIEPRAGGQWYVISEDGGEAVVGHVRVWQPPERFVVGWEINAKWKPDARVELASEVEIRFIAESATRTRVELEHRDFERMGATEGESMRGNVNNGWPGMLECYAKSLAAGERP